MTSRRPMTRSFSGNGRTSSFSEEEGSSSNGRAESRNTYLSNVRPENSYSRYSHYRPARSTLCSVMAQLTEDIQPSFETTLKSKAVSENCNVKFTCVVSGYPAPELKWYKDDMEMDRYCGLPKYEIHRNGKTHTLHIYNCTLDDAAIYQVSASNSKGIVSCSGVLEVGTMNEYKIHQRFFAKLKQKAEKKKRDIEEKGKKDNKENIKKEEQQSSPEHPYRKRSVPPLEEKPVVNNSATAEQPGDVAQSKALIAEGKDAGDIASVNSSLEKEESAEILAKKRIKMSNGLDIGVNTNISKSHMMGNGGENSYDGGISLAQFLAETIQTQSGEESQEEKEMSIVTLRDNKENYTEEKLEEQNEQECISEKRRQEEIVIDKEKKKENQPEAAHTTTHSRLQKPSSSEVKHCSKGQKDHDQHNIHTSISSMLHSVKDFFFGKSKKDSYNISHTDNEDEHFDHSTVLPEPGMPPSFQLQAGHNSEVLENDVVPMETDKASEPSEIVKQQAAPAEPIQFNCEDTGLLQDHKLIPEIVNESAGKRIEEANETVEAMEESTEAERSSPVEKKSLSGFQVQAEEGKKNSEIVSTIEEELPQHQGTGRPLVLQKPNPDSGRDDSLSQKDKEHSLLPPLLKVEDYCTLPQSVISLTENHNPGVALMETLEKEEVSVLNVDKETPDIQEYHSSHRLSKEEKVEVKSNKQPYLDINKPEITNISSCFPEDRIKQCESETLNRVLPALPATVAYSAEKDHLKEEAKRASLIQEANVAYPPSEVPQCLEMGDLKSQREQATVVEEIAEDHQRKTIPSLNFKMCEVKEKYSSASRDDVKMNWCNSLKTQEQLSLQVDDNREVRSESSQLESIKDTILDDEELSKPKTLVVTEDNANSTYVLEERSKTSYSKSNDLAWSAEHDCSTVNIPSVQISTTEDIPDIKLPMPEMNMSEEFIIPTINTMEPDLKECTLPLSILVQNKPGLNDLQKHDETHESKTGIQEQREADFPGTVPKQRGMQHTDDLSPTEKLKEVAQEMYEHQSSAQLPLMECASIPVINVSWSDDLESNTLGISSGGGTENEAFETQTETLFVVPPISVSCHESEAELKLPAPTKTTETETSADTPRGTKQGVTENLSEKPEIPKRKKYLKEISDKSLKENTPSMVGETPMSKVGGSMPTFSKPTDDNIVPEALKQKSPKDAKRESSVEDFLKNRPSVERLSSKPPTYPSLSPSSLRKFMSKAAPELDNETTANVPAISVEDRQSDKADEDFSGGSTPTSSLSCENSPRLKRRDSLTLIRSATPEELASGARRKIFIPKREEELEGAVFSVLEGKKESPYMSPSQARRAALLQASTGQKTPPMERRSPLMSRRKATLEVPKVVEETPTIEPTSTKVEEKPAGKKTDPLKAPQVIRKIRGEPFPDASGHLKLWCQFFNVLSDSTIKWFKDEEEILEMKRSGGDESQVALAVVHASSQDCGVYGCSISNEYGTDTTDFLLSEEILSEFLLKEDLEVGEEIEMTPLVFTKGLADSGTWGEKYFGRIFTETVHIGEGCTHKASRVKVIYGLDPIFESGSTCIIKVRNPIAYGTKQESTLAERNLDIAKQECKVQDMIREYCKIFAAEARVNENFGFSLEVIPRYLIHRPANSVPYATVETDLTGDFGKYCTIDLKGKLFSQNISELDQKCCTFQHWIHQWTHGNLLVTQLEGVETKITNIKVATKSKGYQGLTECGSPEVFDQFVMYHQCNYYCGLLGLRALKTDLQQPAKLKGSRSPLLNRKLGSNSPQLQKKGQSPQMSRKTNVSPKVARKAQETDNSNSDEKQKPTEDLS